MKCNNKLKYLNNMNKILEKLINSTKVNIKTNIDLKITIEINQFVYDIMMLYR